MKTVFLASVAAATLMAAPALAQDAIGSAGMTFINSDVEGLNTDSARLDGVAAFTVAPEWTVTVAGDMAMNSDVMGEENIGSAAAHLTKTFANDIRAGGFIAIDDFGGQNDITIGAEVQKYYASTTLTAVASYTDLNDEMDVWSFGADAAYYVSPSLRLNAGINYTTVDTVASHAEGFAYGAGAEYQFANSPFSVSATYQRSDIEGVDADTFMVGARYNFGGTLQSLDRAGANLGRTLATLIRPAN